MLRTTNVARLAEREFDVLIVGGGINGAVSAAALSARGVSVALVDKGDFASSTSQESSNLVWGGIKYLENGEVPLVWELCRSRNTLMDAYPSSVREVRFFSAVEPSFRHHPAFMWAGTWVYWFMGRGHTKPPRYLTKKDLAEEKALNVDRFRGGVEYSDAYLMDCDARFVFQFIRSALNVGATIANYVKLESATRTHDGKWQAIVCDAETGARFPVRARVLVNAAGPYADRVNGALSASSRHQHVFSKGIHMVVPRITAVERVLTFFDDTGRMFFVIPMGPCSVIGTTDTRVVEPEAVVTDEDRRFLLENANARLALPAPLTEKDIIAERCGVRPLVVEKGESGSDTEWINLSRKHVIETGEQRLTIYGGKLTDCLNIGEEVCGIVEKMGVTVDRSADPWFGEPAPEVRRAFFKQAKLMRLDELRESATFELLSTRLWRRYGLRAFSMLEAIRRDPAQDDVLIEGAQYLRCELYHAAQSEMVTRLEDFLRRRSKIALVVPHEQLRHARGIREACDILFGDRAKERYDQYFSTPEAETEMRTPVVVEQPVAAP
jgi:glycerol-3-phosphate dehydrogenase